MVGLGVLVFLIGVVTPQILTSIYGENGEYMWSCPQYQCTVYDNCTLGGIGDRPDYNDSRGCLHICGTYNVSGEKILRVTNAC